MSAFRVGDVAGRITFVPFWSIIYTLLLHLLLHGLCLPTLVIPI